METNQSQYEKMCEVHQQYVKGELKPVVHAHWIEGEDINCKPIVECSHCGDVWHLDGDSDPFHDHFYYCPNCGAIMDEEVER